MKDSTFHALIRLLDDDDPQVKAQVEEELYALGDDLLNRLQQASEAVADDAVQEQVSRFIERLQLEHFGKELYEWRKDGGKGLLQGWVLLSQVAGPEMDPQHERNALSRIGHRTWLQLSTGMSDLEKLCVINKQLYGLEGFAGNHARPEAPENNLLHYVLEHKTGNALSLSALYAILGGELDIPLQVVNFNGYHALRYYSRSAHFYIDAFDRGVFYTVPQVERFLRRHGANDNVLTYKPLSNIYVALQLIEALVQTYEQAGQTELAERYRQLLAAIDIKLDG